MEHIEEAGIHSGDSACTLPPVTLGRDVINRVREATLGIAKGIGVRGPAQRAVRHRPGRALRARGQPARVPHRAVRLEGARDPAGQGGLAHHGRAQSSASSSQSGMLARAGRLDRAHGCAGRRQRGRAAVQALPHQGGQHRRLGARPGDALDRRGHGHRLATSRARSPRARRPRTAGCPSTRRRCSCRSPTATSARSSCRCCASASSASRSSPPRARPRCSSRNGIEARRSSASTARPGSVEGEPSIVDLINRGEVDVVINTPSGRSARADGYEIRTATVAADKPLFTTIAQLGGAVASFEAIRDGLRRAQPAGLRARPQRPDCDARAAAVTRDRFGDAPRRDCGVRATSGTCASASIRTRTCSSSGGCRRRAGLREFGLRVVEAAAGVAGIVKPQVAFFERHGSAGLSRRSRTSWPRRASAGLLVIADAKRGDLGTSVEAYAQAWLSAGSPLEADAMTVSAFQGVGSLEAPMILASENGKGLFVLAATSNPESFAPRRRSCWKTGTQTVAASIVDEVSRNNAAPLGSFGVVIGATCRLCRLRHHDASTSRRRRSSRPGFGFQGAGLGDVSGTLRRLRLRTSIVSSSRAILEAGPGRHRGRRARAGRASSPRCLPA